MSQKRVYLIIRKCLNKPACNYTQLHVQYIFKLLTIQYRSVCWCSRGLSLSSNHYRQITHESPSGGFRNHNSKAIWKMAKPLYICSVCVCLYVCECTASGHIVMPFWTAALILMSLSTPWPTWPSTGLFSTAGRYRRSAEGTARGLHTNTHTLTNMETQ